MTADVDLPVWTLSPNWSQDILERLQWLTNVLSSKESACEQRIALRINPRRSFEAMFTLEGAERTFADLWVNRIGQGECMVPLWHDRGTLSAAAIGGATTLAVDTVDREFLAGGMALLVGPTPFTCEAVQIDTVADTAITLATPTVNAWPAGTVIHPLRRGRLDAETLSNLTARAGASTLRFNVEGVDDGITGGDLPTYLGRPLLVTPPNWSDTIDTKMMWLGATRESDTGKTFIVDPAGRALPGQQHRWLLHGRAEQRAFRQMLYSLAGRARSLWLPTFAEDMTVTRAAASAATHLDVSIVGLGYVGGPAPGREHVLISGALATKVDSLDTPPSTTEERLVLHTGLSRTVAVGETLSFIDTSRLDQDEVEFVHHADSNGAAECTLVFRAFDASRDGSAAGALEIAEAAMNDTACGSSGARIKHEILGDHVMRGYARDAAQTYVMTFAGPAGVSGESGATKVFDMQAETVVSEFINNLAWSYSGIVQGSPLNNRIAFSMIDSAGTIWGTDVSIYPTSGHRLLVSVEDFGTGPVTTHGPWTSNGYSDSNGFDSSCNITRQACFDLPGGDRAFVWVPSNGEARADNYAHSFVVGGSIQDYQALAGTGSSWVIRAVMQDEHGDVWAIGTPHTTGDINSIYLWRIIEAGGSPIVTGFAHVTGMPTIAGFGGPYGTNSTPTGFASGGKFYISFGETGSITRIDPATMTVDTTYTPGAGRSFPTFETPAGAATMIVPIGFGTSFDVLRLSDFTMTGTFEVSEWSPAIPYVGVIDYDPTKGAMIGVGDSGGDGTNCTSIGWYTRA